tara:strand:- start:1333 stop:1821 length:489 start_codon:yes stop_codon:yes gene_type:complete
MTKFYNGSFDNRMKTAGDPSEEACDKVYGYRTHKLGLDRVWQNGVGLYMAQMTPAMRYTPDRMIIDRNIECMGIGRDKTLKIKTEKIEAMSAWEHIGPIDLFVFDQPNNTYYQAPLEEWRLAIVAHGKADVFPEGKPFWAIHAVNFPSEAEEVPRVETLAPI